MSAAVEGARIAAPTIPVMHLPRGGQGIFEPEATFDEGRALDSADLLPQLAAAVSNSGLILRENAALLVSPPPALRRIADVGTIQHRRRWRLPDGRLVALNVQLTIVDSRE